MEDFLKYLLINTKFDAYFIKRYKNLYISYLSQQPILRIKTTFLVLQST